MVPGWLWGRLPEMAKRMNAKGKTLGTTEMGVWGDGEAE